MAKKTLMEAYQKRIAIAEKLYKEERNGQGLSESKKSIIAQVLNNTNQYLTEAFGSGQAVQTATVGGTNAWASNQSGLGQLDIKRFCLDIANITMPNLIAMDLVITKPMNAAHGFLRYLKFVAGNAKGGVADGQMFNSAFKLGEMNESRVNYTGNSVVEPLVGAFTSGTTAVAFKQGAAFVDALDTNGASVIDKTGTAWTIDATTGVITAGAYASGKSATDVKKIAYTYNNVEIPQETIPTIRADFDTIQLEAKARRIAIYYSTLAQYTYKVESGVDLGTKLKEQAIAEIQYEIDNEVTYLLRDLAFKNADGTPRADFQTFYAKKPVGISLREHYMSILSTVTKAGTVIHTATQKYRPNFLVVSPEFIEILTLCDNFKANEVKPGPYFLGTLAGLKVFVSPQLVNEAYVGYNGGDEVTAAAVFAPFMVCTPTMLLEMPDNAAMQGFSMLYDLKPLNTALVAGIKLDWVTPDPIYVEAVQGN